MATPVSSFDAARSLGWGLVLALALATPLPVAARAKPPAPAPAPAPVTFESELRRQAEQDLLGFYAARQYRPVWITPTGELDPAAHELSELLASAAIDGVEPAALPAGEVAATLGRFGHDASPAARASAELALSRALAAYVLAMRQAPTASMSYEHSSLAPAAPRRPDVIWEAAAAPVLADYVREMRWMHPLYAPLRRAAVADPAADPVIQQAVLDNLARIRALAPAPSGRSIVVDAASARLWMYEGGRLVDSMRVVVGKPTNQTPMLAGYIRQAIVNPYWNVPEDMVPNRIAPNVVRRGLGYLKAQGYEVLADWSADAAPLDPASVDWPAVAKGETQLRLRQRPGGTNAMGKVKFEFPNPLGIYLHDTPEKNLLREELRQFSGGCIRLEDAARLGAWLLEAPLPPAGETPEQRIDLPKIVPIYITYLTVHAEDGKLALGPDPYGRDGAKRSAVAQQTAVK